MITTQPRLTVDIHRDQISGQVAQFLAAGGAIQPVPSGVSGEKQFSIWARGQMVVSDAPKPERKRPVQSGRRPGPREMRAANEGKRQKAAALRALMAENVRELARNGASINGASQELGIDRKTLRKIASEHGIEFNTKSLKAVVDEYLATS